jgi:Mrp family chromosome partitioning ATPase
MPFLGTIPQVDQTKNYLTVANSRSGSRTRSYFLTYHCCPQNGLGHVILFTSSIKEGKSFSAFHNALTMSGLNKKVYWTDLRNPQLHDYFKVRKHWDFLISLIKSRLEKLPEDANYSEKSRHTFLRNNTT